MKLRARRPAPATLIALLALFVALGGPAEARRLIDGKLIRKGTVRSKQVKDRSLATRDLSRSAVASLTRTPTGSIGPAQLAFGAVTADAIAAGAVTAPALAAASVGGGAIADGQIGTADLAGSSVTRSKLAPRSVGASEIVEGAIDGGEVLDGGLDAKDVATFAGRVAVDAQVVPLGDCVSFDREVTPIRAGATLPGTAVALAPSAGWPDALLVQARGTAATTLRLTICNPTAQPVAVPGEQSVAFAALAVG
ncbi:MAG TPA: hypothetical protein VM266_07170 [Solirubrobacteraceae bacterium]|nr:hypothetical protein [Solirubrobacteraceae bacterium]